MGGVYGNMLDYFPELLETYTVYEQRPNIGAGYTEVEGSRRTIRGYPQNVLGAALNARDSYSKSADSTGTGSGIISIIDRNQFWSSENIALFGWFIIIEGVVFRFMSNGRWSKEGGFYVYEVHKIVGNDGEPEVNVQLVGGEF